MSDVDDELEYWLSQRTDKAMKKSDKVKFTFDDEGGSLENMTEEGPILRDRVIQAAIHWHNADGRNLEFTETTGNLNIAVAEYLQTVENAPDKLLRYSELIQIFENEIKWCVANPGAPINHEFNRGFLNALIQAKYLVNQLAGMDKKPPGYMGDIGGTPYGPSDRDDDYLGECTCGTGAGTIDPDEHAKSCPMFYVEDQSEAGLNTRSE